MVLEVLRPAVVKMHNIQDGDNQPDLIECGCHNWRFRDPSRNLRMAAAHDHLADCYRAAADAETK